MSGRLIVVCSAMLALATGAARADTLVVCSEASPNALNSALSNANTSFDVSEQIADRLVEMEPGGIEGDPGAGRILDRFRRTGCATLSSCGTG